MSAIETFYLKFTEDANSVLTTVECKVPRQVASSAAQAAELVAEQKKGRMIPHPLGIHSDEEYYYVPVDTGGFENSLPREPIVRRTLSLEERFEAAKEITN